MCSYKCFSNLLLVPTIHHCLESIVSRIPNWLPWELLYTDDLVIMADTMDELLRKLDLWKKHLEFKGLRLNMGKIKTMICGNLHLLKDSGKHHCGVCRKEVGSNSIFCDGFQSWVQKKCTGSKGRLKADPNYRCKRYIDRWIVDLINM